MKIITKGNGDTAARQNSQGPTSYSNKENTNSKIEWDRMESFEGQYNLQERDLSWDYSDGNIPYEGSYLTTLEGLSKRTRVGPKGT